MQSKINVIAQINPFKSDFKTYKTDVKSLRQIYEELGIRLPVSCARMMIDDEVVTDIDRIPAAGQTVYIKLVPAGDNKSGGKGMGWVGALMVIAGTVMSIVSYGTLSGPGAALIGAGVGLIAGGVALYNTNIPRVGDTGREGIETAPSIRGSRNQANPWGPVPYLLGKHLMFPLLAASNYTTVGSDIAGTVSSDGTRNNQYLVQLFCLGYNNINIDYSTIKIGDTSIIDLSQTKDINKILSGQDEYIRLEVISDGTASAVYPKVCKETSIGLELKQATPLVRTTTADTTKIVVDIYLPSGLGQYDDDGDLNNRSIEVVAEYKTAGDPDASYQLLGYWKTTNILTAATLKSMRHQITKSVTSGQYDVRLRRVTADSTDSKIIDKVYWATLKSFRNDDAIRDSARQKLTIIALKARATDLLNGYVDQLNLVGQTRLPVYSGSGTGATAWGASAATSNPAAIYKYILQGTLNTDPLPNEYINWASLESWYIWCRDHNYQCNVYISSEMTLRELLTNITATARADFAKVGNKVGVVQDIAKSTPVQLFTPRNTWGFECSKSFTAIPNAMHMQFVNASAGYADDERIIPDETGGYSLSHPGATKQTVNLWGITDTAQAYLIGKYMYAVTYLRPWIYTFNCDIEYLIATRGSRALLAHDVPLRGKSWGRISSRIITGGQVVGFVVDEEITMESGKTYSLRVRKSDGSLVLYPLVLTVGSSYNVQLQTPLALSSAPDGGDLFAFGESGSVTSDVLVIGIEPMEDLTAKITCVDYSPEIFGVDDPDYVIPPYTPNITRGGIIDDGQIKQPMAPTPASIADVNEAVKKILQGNVSYIPADVTSIGAVASERGIAVSPVSAQIHLTDGLKYKYQIKRGDSATWDDITVVSGMYLFSRSTDGYPEKSVLDTWSIRAKAVNVYGNESENWYEETISTDAYGTWLVQQPNVVASVNGRSVRLTMSQVSSTQVYGNIRYQVEISRYDDVSGSVRTWYKPNITANYLASESAYKDGSGSVVASETFQQTLPLEGQNASEPAPIDTTYMYRITPYNEAGSGTAATVTVAALAVTARDVVQAWKYNEQGEKVEVPGGLRAKNIYTDNLAAISALFGEISGGTRDNFWDLDAAEFRLGNNHQYEDTDDPRANYIHYVDGLIKARLGQLMVEAGETFYRLILNIYNDAKTRRNALTYQGVELQHKDGNNFVFDGKVDVDESGTMTIANTEDIPQGYDVGLPALTASTEWYHFDSDLLNQRGEGNITISPLSGGIAPGLIGKPTITPAVSDGTYDKTKGKVLYGNYSLSAPMGNSGRAIATMYIMLKSSGYLKIAEFGTSYDKVKLEILAQEPAYNDSGSPAYNDSGEPAYNSPRTLRILLTHEGRYSSECVELSISIALDEWYALGLVLKSSAVGIYLAGEEYLFTRYGVVTEPCTMTVNSTKSLIAIDELMVDGTTDMSLASFVAAVASGLPYGTHSASDRYMRILAEDPTKVMSNFLYRKDEIDAQRQAILAKFGDGSVTKVANGAINNAAIADNAVSGTKIQNGAVTATKLAEYSVATDKIGNKAVTTDKLDDAAVTTSKIQTSVIPLSKMIVQHTTFSGSGQSGRNFSITMPNMTGLIVYFYARNMVNCLLSGSCHISQGFRIDFTNTTENITASATVDIYWIG